MGIENAEVARLFRETADLLELQGANAFRVRAYQTAARTIEELPQPVEELVRANGKRLTALPGIGKDLAGKIGEIVRTGTLGTLRELRHQVPKGLAALMAVRGLGPKRARALYDALGIHTMAQLERACRGGKVRGLPRFGARTEANLLRELEARRAGEHRMLRPVAAQYGEAYLRYLQSGEGSSAPRSREPSPPATPWAIHILVCCSRGTPAVERFVAHPEVEVLSVVYPHRSTWTGPGDLRVLPASAMAGSTTSPGPRRTTSRCAGWRRSAGCGSTSMGYTAGPAG
jgi:DNA polymerase (family 10)